MSSNEATPKGLTGDAKVSVRGRRAYPGDAQDGHCRNEQPYRNSRIGTAASTSRV